MGRRILFEAIELMECKRVIARRVFQTRTGENVVATIFEALEVSMHDWRCEFEITGLSPEIHGFGPGVDSMHAVTNALVGIRMQLERIGEDLVWFDAEPGCFGIARPIPSSFGTGVEKFLVALVERTVARLVAEKLRQEARALSGEAGSEDEPDSDPEIVRLAAEKLREEATDESHSDSDCTGPSTL